MQGNLAGNYASFYSVSHSLLKVKSILTHCYKNAEIKIHLEKVGWKNVSEKIIKL